jgi:hypothetical protein
VVFWVMTQCSIVGGKALSMPLVACMVRLLFDPEYRGSRLPSSGKHQTTRRHIKYGNKYRYLDGHPIETSDRTLFI